MVSRYHITSAFNPPFHGGCPTCGQALAAGWPIFEVLSLVAELYQGLGGIKIAATPWGAVCGKNGDLKKPSYDLFFSNREKDGYMKMLEDLSGFWFLYSSGVSGLCVCYRSTMANLHVRNV